MEDTDCIRKLQQVENHTSFNVPVHGCLPAYLEQPYPTWMGTWNSLTEPFQHNTHNASGLSTVDPLEN